MIVLLVLWYFIQQYLVWVLLSTYPANILGFLVKGHCFVPFKHSSYSFIFYVSQTTLRGKCPILGFVDISYGVFLVPPSKWDDKVIFSCRSYLTRYVRAVAVFSNLEEDRMCEVLSS